MLSHAIQNNFLAGVLDPRASARVETDVYNRALLRGVNVTPSHLGGVRRRGGLRKAANLPNVLTRLTAGITITAPNGGMTANANDNNAATLVVTTTNVSTLNPYVVIHYDLGAAQSVVAVDSLNLRLTSGSSDDFVIQYSTDNSVWNFYNPAFGPGGRLDPVDVTARSYRRGGDAALPILARYWRVARDSGDDLGTAKVELGEFNLWVNTSTISAVRLLPFEISPEDRFLVALTDRSAIVYGVDQLGVSSVVSVLPSPYASADLAKVDADVDGVDMVLVHENYPPRFLFRDTTVNGLTGVTNFFSKEIEFEQVPITDFADTLSPTPTSEIQVITFASFVAGNTFQITLDGARSGAIAFAGDGAAAEQTTTAANIAREVQKLYTVRGFTGVSCVRTGTLAYTVTFADASAGTYGLMAVTALAGSGTATVARTQAGVPRTEAVWSAARGYPRTTVFFGGRLYFGGTRSRKASFFGSETNNILNFETREGLADEPIFTTLSGAKAVNGLFAGRTLQAFTNGGELRYVKPQGDAIVPGDVPANQTQYGSAKIRPVTIDGATIFVHRTGKSIRDFRFSFEEDAYDSLGVSSLASHLIYDVKDLAAWNGSRKDEIGLVFVVNGINPSTDTDKFPDGSVAVFNSRKEAEVQAWTIWTTDGEFKAVGVVLEDIYFAVKRDIDGVQRLFLEQYDETYYTDCAAKVNAGGVAQIPVSPGLLHLVGETVRIRTADHFVLASQVVPAAGNMTLEIVPVDPVEVGLNFNPEATPMPLNTMTPTPNFMRKRRIVKVYAKVRNTLGLRCNGRPLPDRFFDLNNFDQAPTLFTGNHSLEETTNWDEKQDKLVAFTQSDPLPMELLAIDVLLEGSE